ncbi:unnamed protein product [Trypanosoma congolense IL3000]|uniref:WGS project CAEQ00000000 data, annotated contig 2300 n=1 Tax=Trypanosoma congolense (strain IL3000) TaxID=1068625 RepID=F9WCZ9_TRYCI|nr:unnamed protein product [Trypanosoma congolense IL3000]
MGGVPSREEGTVVYSYLRGTYEIGLIPLTKALFGRDSALNGRGENSLLRKNFLQMRADLHEASSGPNRSKVLSWTEVKPCEITEHDLDEFLELVEQQLYATDAAMVMDHAAPLFPVPCAVCLVCKDGHDRHGSFRWRGRSIVVIGYFGCMNEALQSAFKTSTRGSCNGEYSITAAVFPSIGDRTFDRVLALAPVMLRMQFINSVRKYEQIVERSILADMNGINISDSVHGLSSVGLVRKNGKYWLPHGNAALSPGSLFQEAEKMFLKRISHMPVFLEVSPGSYSSLKSLVENAAFIQIHTTVSGAQCRLELPQSFQEYSHCTSIGNECDRHGDSCEAQAQKTGGSSLFGDHFNDLFSFPVQNDESFLGPSGGGDLFFFDPIDPLPHQHCWKEVVTTDPSEVVRIHFDEVYVARAIMWLSNLFRRPTLFENICWMHYAIKKEENDTRRMLCNRDAIVADWRASHPELAKSFLGSGTSILLHHMCALQQELQRTRANTTEATVTKKPDTTEPTTRRKADTTEPTTRRRTNSAEPTSRRRTNAASGPRHHLVAAGRQPRPRPTPVVSCVPQPIAPPVYLIQPQPVGAPMYVPVVTVPQTPPQFPMCYVSYCEEPMVASNCFFSKPMP